MNTVENEINERAALTSSNKFELMLFRLGRCGGADRSELYGVNVFKLRELMAMPDITTIAGAPPHLLGVVNIRGQIVLVIDLPALLGCKPENGLKILEASLSSSGIGKSGNGSPHLFAASFISNVFSKTDSNIL